VYRPWPQLIGYRKSRSRSKPQRSMQKCACYTSIYSPVLWVLTDGHSSRFTLRRYQLWASAARRLACAAETSGRGGVQRVRIDSAVSLSLIARGQFFSSWTCCDEKDIVHKSGKMDRRLNSIQTAWPSCGQSYYIVYVTHLMMPIETIMSDVASFLYTPILYYKRSRSAVADYKSC